MYASAQYINIISINQKPVVYGCEIWRIFLREEHTLRVFENRALGKIFRSKGEEVRGEWRRLHNEELYVMYLSPVIIRVIK
jgi:hypothetical protein